MASTVSVGKIYIWTDKNGVEHISDQPPPKDIKPKETINTIKKPKIQKDLSNPEVLLNQGIAYGKAGQYDRSIAYFNKAIELNPRFAKAYKNRGEIFYRKGQSFNAIADFTKAIEINPWDAEVYSNRGAVYSELRLYDKAIADCTKAIVLNPRLASAYYNRGVVYGKDKGQYDQAISDFNKAIEINPRYASAYYNRGHSYYYSNHRDKACSNWKRACGLGSREGCQMAKRKDVCQ